MMHDLSMFMLGVGVSSAVWGSMEGYIYRKQKKQYDAALDGYFKNMAEQLRQAGIRSVVVRDGGKDKPQAE